MAAIVKGRWVNVKFTSTQTDAVVYQYVAGIMQFLDIPHLAILALALAKWSIACN